MSTKRGLLAVLIASALALVIGLGPERAGMAQGPVPPAAGSRGPGADPETPVAPYAGALILPYAGALSGPAGEPVADGLYAFAFALYTAETGGELLWSEVQEEVAVQEGAFETALGRATALPAALLDGGARWLSLSVRGPGEAAFTALAPRQPFSAASTAQVGAAAGAACPHDHVGEVWQGNVAWSNGAFKVLNYGNGPSIWGWNGGNGNGIRGYATGTGLGVYGESQNNAGVVGRSTSGRGVEGYTQTNGQYGVYGKNESSQGGIGVLGYAPNGTGVGVLGQGPGFGVYAKGDLRVEGYSFFDGGKSGYVVEVAQNDDAVSLEAGDLVAISGVGPAVMGEIPVIKVRRATADQAGAIVGIVDKRFRPAPEGADPSATSKSTVDDAAIGPGEHLTMVTLGAYKAIKVDASYGAIAPGDRLVASPHPGYAMRADAPLPGTIVGKALDALPSGTGVIPVIVTLQ
jgi:hypothetical protein